MAAASFPEGNPEDFGIGNSGEQEIHHNPVQLAQYILDKEGTSFSGSTSSEAGAVFHKFTWSSENTGQGFSLSRAQSKSKGTIYWFYVTEPDETRTTTRYTLDDDVDGVSNIQDKTDPKYPGIVQEVLSNEFRSEINKTVFDLLATIPFDTPYTKAQKLPSRSTIRKGALAVGNVLEKVVPAPPDAMFTKIAQRVTLDILAEDPRGKELLAIIDDNPDAVLNKPSKVNKAIGRYMRNQNPASLISEQQIRQTVFERGRDRFAA